MVSYSDSEDDMTLLLAKIESTKFCLQAKTEQLENLKEREANPTAVDVLKQRVKALVNTIEERQKDFDEFKQNRDLYVKQLLCGKEFTVDISLLWESKLLTLQRRRDHAEDKKQRLYLEIQEKEKKVVDAFFDQIRE